MHGVLYIRRLLELGGLDRRERHIGAMGSPGLNGGKQNRSS